MKGTWMKLEAGFYKRVIKPICFGFDPEYVHNTFISTGGFLASNPITRRMTSMALEYTNPILEQTLMGIKFRNPVGLSAGFDKNGSAAAVMKSVGFGFTEVGSVTALPCAGNSGVRLKRIKEKESILVHMGLNNNGAVAIHKSLFGRKIGIPMIVSSAKTNCKETTDPEVGLKDYLFTINEFRDTADIFELNISCPNAFGGQDFADPALFERLAKGVSDLKVKQPVIVKLSPDLTNDNIDSIIDTSAKYNISGFVCTNLTKDHNEGEGGLSGKAVQEKADALASSRLQKEYRI